MPDRRPKRSRRRRAGANPQMPGSATSPARSPRTPRIGRRCLLDAAAPPIAAAERERIAARRKASALPRTGQAVRHAELIQEGNR